MVIPSGVPVSGINCGSGTNTIATLAAGAVATCVASDYLLLEEDVTVGRLEDLGSATGKDPANRDVHDSDSRVLNNGEPAGLQLEKTAFLFTDVGSNGLEAGDTLQYTLVVTNTGKTTLTNVTATDAKLGYALNGSSVCSPALGSTLASGEQMVCKLKYVVVPGEASPIDNLATATGRPVGRQLPVDASGNHVVSYARVEPPQPLYTIGNRVWLDANDDGLAQSTERGFDGVQVRLQMSDTTATTPSWVQATFSNGVAIPDRVTAAGGFYEFVDVPERSTHLYRVQILPINSKSDTTGTKPLYGTGSSKVDDGSALPWTNDRDQGIGSIWNTTNGVLSRSFSLAQVGTSRFDQVDFGFTRKLTSAPPDPELIQSASVAQVKRGSSLTYTLHASNAVGAGPILNQTVITETLPAGQTVTAGWPIVQPVGWTCSVNAARSVVTCNYASALPTTGIPGGSLLGGPIQIPVTVAATAATGNKTTTGVISKLSGEPSWINNTGTAMVRIIP